MRNAYCSFCRKSYKDVGPLVEGPGGVYICGECVELTQNILDQDLSDYLEAQGGPITPTIQHRIHCTDSDPGTAPACPVGSP